MLAPGTVRITCADPSVTLVVGLGPDPVKLTGGGGGWESVARPHQTAMTIWTGGAPYTLALPLMLDAFPTGSVEATVRVLNRLARGDDDSEPGIVEVEGVPLPVDEWVVDGLDWGDAIRASDDLRLQRQAVTLSLLEHVPPELVQTRRRSLVKPRRKTRIVKVKRGDTPAKIARRARCKWTDLRDLNPGIVIRANQKVAATGDKFKVGMSLRAPVAPPAKRATGKAGRGRAGGTTTRKRD